MPFALTTIDAGINAMAALITHITLLDESGAELAVTRQAVGWDASSSGVALLADAESFAVPAAVTAAFWAGFSALTAGTERCRFPLQGNSLTDAQRRPMLGVVNDSASTDTIKSDTHGLANTNRVVIYAENAQALPTGITAGVVYWVINANTDDFQISTTSGGSAVAITTDGELFFMRCIPESFGDAGTLSLADQAIALAGTIL